MKNLFKTALIAVCCLFVSFSSNLYAQNMAHIDTETIVPNMESYKKAKSEVESYGKILQKQLEGKEAEMQAYYMDVSEKIKRGELTPIQQKEAEAKLQKMQDDLQKAAQEAEAQLYNKEQELLKPVFDEFNKAVQSVCKESGYSYILDIKYILYAEGGIDATAKVKAKLGVQ